MTEKDLSKLKIERKAGVSGFKRPRRRIYWAAAAVLVIALVLLASGAFSPVIEVKQATVSLTYPSQAITLLNASGYVVAQRKASVAAKTTGRLVWLGVEEGSRVRSGQVIARLENDDVKAARAEALARLNASRKNLEQADAELENARVSLKRDKDLLSTGIISQSEYDASEARYKKAAAATEAARASVNASEAALTSADVSLEYTLIKAPFDAVILTKNADVGDIITPLGAAANAKAAVVTIADMGSLQVEADVSESNIGKVAIGQPCEIQLDAVPDKRFAGMVHMIVPTADRTKASVLVKVRFLERDERVLPEMSAKVAFLSREVTAGEKRPRVTVSPAAIVEEEGAKYLFVIRDGTVERVQVTTGAPLGDSVEVSGVKPGDKIAVDTGKLKDGSKIRVAEK